MLKALLLHAATSFGRHLLTAAAGTLVATHWLTQTDADKGVGAVIVLAAVGWSAFQNYQNRTQIPAAFPELPATRSKPGTTADDLNEEELGIITKGR